MTDLERIGRLCTDFGFRLYRRLGSEGNRFFSPMSIAMALAAVLAGSRGETRRELAVALGIGEDELSGFSELVRSLQLRRAIERDWNQATQKVVEIERDQFVLRMANALFVARSYALREDYLEKARDWFQSASIATDFAAPAAAAALINQWVEERTNGRIPKLIEERSIGSGTRLVVVNAIYFFSQWLEQFEEAATRPKPFYLTADRSRTVDVRMMHRTTEFRYMADPLLGFEAASLPYKAMSMLVIRPDFGRLDAVEGALELELLDRISRELAFRRLALGLPKFEIEWGCDLAGLLDALGVRRLFTRDADLGGITADPQGLYVTSVIHQANVTVDENGTEAAAATAVMAELGMALGEPPKPHPFIVDRPFLFVIWDEPTRAVIFAGRVMNP